MKIYLSADMEGVAGITHWDEATPSMPQYYRYFQEQMTEDVRAACIGALEAGATEIWVKDAHSHGRNIISDRLPREARLIRGWSKHPYMMVQEIDASFDAVAFVGYHARATSGGNPLAHTLSNGMYSALRINGELISEFRLYAQAAMLEGVPSVFVSGDRELCEEDVRAYDERIVTVSTSDARGASTISLHPQVAREKIQNGLCQALKRDFKTWLKPLPKEFHVELTYRNARDAYKNSFYPGARAISAHAVGFETQNYFDVLRFLTFGLSGA